VTSRKSLLVLLLLSSILLLASDRYSTNRSHRSSLPRPPSPSPRLSRFHLDEDKSLETQALQKVEQGYSGRGELYRDKQGEVSGSFVRFTQSFPPFPDILTPTCPCRVSPGYNFAPPTQRIISQGSPPALPARTRPSFLFIPSTPPHRPSVLLIRQTPASPQHYSSDATVTMMPHFPFRSPPFRTFAFHRQLFPPSRLALLSLLKAVPTALLSHPVLGDTASAAFCLMSLLDLLTGCFPLCCPASFSRVARVENGY
jgi:hypothetical protein